MNAPTIAQKIQSCICCIVVFSGRLTPPRAIIRHSAYQVLRNSPGSLAIFDAIRLASSFVSSLAADCQLARDQLASRQVVAGSSRSSAPSCNRTGSRSPSIAVRNTERASSSGFTVLLPTDLSVSHASSKAASKSMSVAGSKELLWNPRMARPQSFHTDTDIFG